MHGRYDMAAALHRRALDHVHWGDQGMSCWGCMAPCAAWAVGACTVAAACRRAADGLLPSANTTNERVRPAVLN